MLRTASIVSFIFYIVMLSYYPSTRSVSSQVSTAFNSRFRDLSSRSSHSSFAGRFADPSVRGMVDCLEEQRTGFWMSRVHHALRVRRRCEWPRLVIIRREFSESKTVRWWSARIGLSWVREMMPARPM